jgi:hypothetical protein
MTARFVPQPYPLFAVTVVKAEDPVRFALPDDPVRLVLGWVQDDDGTVLPALADSPSPTVWNGMVLYEQTRERAEATAKRWGKIERKMIRDARIMGLLNRFDRFDAYLGRISRKVWS